jgi:hypothetical protein
MNFTNRDSNTQPSQPARNNQSSSNIAGPINNALKSGRKKGLDWMKGGFAVMLISLTIIVLGTVYLLHIANPNSGKYVKNNKFQAVFLQNGQLVYFGHIKGISQKYIYLEDIFYLNNDGASAPTSTNASKSVSLVKLGCELHGPYDEMVLNADQVSFWENMKDDSKVVKAIAQYAKDNPKGQVCTDTSKSTTQSTTGTTQNPGTTTPAKQ